MITYEPTVTYINQFVDREFVTKMFTKFSIKYGKLWTNRMGDDPDWEACLDDWTEELSKFTIAEATQAREKCYLIYKEFPPTQLQFIDLCRKASGIPDEDDVIRMMVSRDFSHPIVKMVYDRIGSWTLKNGRHEEIKTKTREHYPFCVVEFEENPHSHWKRLQEYKDEKLKELPPPDKNPTKGESKAFRDCMNECQRILQGKKIVNEGKTYRQFDEAQITPTHRDFDPEVYEEFRKYLISVPETETMILPPQYSYRRMKFLAMEDQRRFNNNPNPQGQSNSQNRGTREPFKVYKNYTGD